MPWPRDPPADPSAWGVHHEDPPPYNVLRGPVHGRGPVSGVVWHAGARESPPGASRIAPS